MVDVGTVRFHDVVGEAVGVVAVVVVNAQRGQQPAGYESPGHDGAQNGVAVVEQVVGRYTVAFAPEVRNPGEEVVPIVDGRPGFHIVGIAAAYLVYPLQHIAVFDSEAVQ